MQVDADLNTHEQGSVGPATLNANDETHMDVNEGTANNRNLTKSFKLPIHRWAIGTASLNSNETTYTRILYAATATITTSINKQHQKVNGIDAIDCRPLISDSPEIY